MNIILYCQYVWGMGHLVRSLELARALAGHEVILAAGGQPVPLELPSHVELIRLPALYMDEMFTTLVAGEPGSTVDEIRHSRGRILDDLFRSRRPDVFIVELYPFGRSMFSYELDPLLEKIRSGRFGDVKTVCSLRDILVEKRDPAAYEARVLKKLNEFFDLLLVHSDERLLRLDATFGRTAGIQVPVVYTGFITRRPDPAAGRRLRRELGVSCDRKLIVASAGGGRSGHRLIAAVLDACRHLGARMPVRLEAFAGPFMPEGQFKSLAAGAGPGLRVRRYTRRLGDYLQAADLSVSLAGYNTCMDLLCTGVPALVCPYTRQQEQPLRVEKIKDFAPIRILSDDDLQTARLSGCMEQMLARHRRRKPPPDLNLDGARRAARYLADWMGEKGT